MNDAVRHALVEVRQYAREPVINPATGHPFKPGDTFGEWKGRFTPNELRSIREHGFPQPVPSLLDHIANLERDVLSGHRTVLTADDWAFCEADGEDWPCEAVGRIGGVWRK